MEQNILDKIKSVDNELFAAALVAVMKEDAVVRDYVYAVIVDKYLPSATKPNLREFAAFLEAFAQSTVADVLPMLHAALATLHRSDTAHSTGAQPKC